MVDDRKQADLGQIKLSSWVIGAFVLIALAFLVANAYSPSNGVYTNQSYERIKRMLVTLFAFSVILERAIEVFIVLIARPRALGEIEEVERGRSDADVMSPIGETNDIDAERSAHSRAILAEQTIRRHRYLTAELTVGLTFIIGLMLTYCGLHPLAEFMAPTESGLQSHLFYMLDALLTAALLAGGSKGVHTAANAILSFVKRLGSEAPRRWKRTR
jgi:hypothetical protein